SDPTTPNTSTQATTVNTSADLSIVKTDSPDPATAGNNLTYTLSVTNAGPSNAASLSVSDPLPAGTSFVSASGTGWTCANSSGTVTSTRASLAVTTAPDITFVVTVDPPPPATPPFPYTTLFRSSDPTTPNTSTQATTVNTSAD